MEAVLFQNKRILAVIPARGGSKGVPLKNIREVGGKPLIAWAIEAVKKSLYIDRLILSSDDDRIIAKAQEWGCEVPFKRPEDLARDDSSSIDVVLHAAESIPGYEIIVVVQPTSPLVEPSDIDSCIEKLFETSAKSSVSITEPSKSPYWMFTLDAKGFIAPLMDESFLQKRRQDLPSAFIPNGAVYVAYIDWLFKTKSFYGKETACHIMPKERSLDIDTEMDFVFMDACLKLKFEK